MKHANVLISLCLVLVASAVIAYVYIGPKGSEGSNNLESRVSEQLVIFGFPTGDGTQSISFSIIHIGTAEVTISEIRVDNVLNSSSPGWIGNGTLIPGQMGQITLYGLKYFADGFKEGDSYQFRFITARGNSFYCVVVYDGFTFMQTEELKITSMTFAGNSGNSSNTIQLAVKNTGTAKTTVASAQVNDVTKQVSGTTVYEAGDTGTITVLSVGWTTGNKYKVTLLSSTGTRIAAYEDIA